jgi:hypothetical protein
MLIFILVIVMGLVGWSLHLMQEAIDQREFSLMLAGTLVAFSAAAMLSVYFLMGNYVGYVAQISHDTAYMSQPDIPITWSAEDLQEVQAFYQ